MSVFLILASISLGALFGYRFSLQENTIQQRGVLFLEGKETNIAMVLDNKTSLISLPHVDSNIDLGNHTVKLVKAGYHPITVDFASSKDKAVHLKIEFTPLESRITSTVFTSSETRKHFFLNDHIFLEYYPETRVLSFFEEAASLKLHKPEKVFKLDFLKSDEKLEDVRSFKENKVILKTNSQWRICTLDILSCAPINTDIQDEVFSEQKTLLVFKKAKHELWSIQEQNGTLGTLIAKDVKNIAANDLLPRTPTLTYSHIYESLSGSGNILKQDFFGTQRLSTLFTTTLPLKALQVRSDDILAVTATGALISEKSDTIIQSDIKTLYPEIKNTLLITSSGNILLQTPTELEFLTRFSTEPKAIFTLENALYGFVAFPNEILHCEQQKLSYCTHLLTTGSFTAIFYVPEEKFFVLVDSSNPNAIIYTLYFLPSEEDHL